MFIKPIAGATVQAPGSHSIVPAEGMEVPADTFWLRRVADGSVVVIEKEMKVPVEELKTEAAVESANNSRRGGR